ncbi:alpha/beta fold hydrolase [Streptomyces alboflavus]|uniref:alpha/beta fold hydrolase n=1 Tax=Streptomyces alboflavus TaxID=67267 RepID=UPI0004C1B854|nr:alpha/beta hydrolase [Streptomyces alboflavus]
MTLPRTAPASVPVLVLGGGLQNRHSWSRLERHLGHRHPLLIPELPPARCRSDLTWDDLTDAALRATDHLGIGHFATLGVSSGYPVAYRLAQQHPERLTALLLFGASPRPGPRLTALIHEGIRRQAPTASPVPLREAAGDPHGAAAGQRESAEQLVDVLTNPQAGSGCLMIRAAARVLLRQLADSDQDPLVRYVTDRGHLLLDQPLPEGGIEHVRALVGVGEHDTITTIDDNRAVARTIGDATLAVMKHADHLLHMERDADFADLIGRFLHQQPLTTRDTTTTPP